MYLLKIVFFIANWYFTKGYQSHWLEDLEVRHDDEHIPHQPCKRAAVPQAIP